MADKMTVIDPLGDVEAIRQLSELRLLHCEALQAEVEKLHAEELVMRADFEKLQAEGAAMRAAAFKQKSEKKQDAPTQPSIYGASGRSLLLLVAGQLLTDPKETCERIAAEPICRAINQALAEVDDPDLKKHFETARRWAATR